MTLGPLGMLTHATSSSDAADTVETRSRFMVGSAAGRRPRRYALPAPGTFLDVRIIGLGLGAVVPIGGRLRRPRLRAALLDVSRRHGRRRHDRGLVVGVIGGVVPRVERSADHNAEMHAPVVPSQRW